MSFDTTDLAIIETSLFVIEEPARDIIARLIEMVREHGAGGVKIALLEEKILELDEKIGDLESERDDSKSNLGELQKHIAHYLEGGF